VAVVLCLLFALTVCKPAHAADADKTVRVGYVLVDGYQEGGEGEYKSGFGYEYLQRISDLTGWQYEYVYGSFSELFTALKDGDIDLMGDISYTDDRSIQMLFPDLSQGKENYYLYTTEEVGNVNPNRLEEMEQLVIGVTKDSFQDKLLTEWLSDRGYDVPVKKYAGTQELLDSLLLGEINAFAMSDLYSEGFQYIPITSIGFSDFYICVSLERPDLLSELNDALHKIQYRNPFFNEYTYSKYNSFSAISRILTQDEKNWLLEHGNTIRFGFLKNNMPYIGLSDEGELLGLIPRVLKEIEDSFGLVVETTAFAHIEELRMALQSGEIDIAGPFFCDFWLLEQYNLSASDGVYTTALLFAHRDSDVADSMHKIAYSSDSAIQLGIIKAKFPSAEPVEYPSLEACFQAVVNGEAYSTPITSLSMNLYRQNEDFNKLQITGIPKNIEIILCGTRGNSAPIGIVNKAIFATREDLQGTTLAEATYIEKEISLSLLVDKYGKEIIFFLVFLLLIVIFLVLYYRHIIYQMGRVQAANQLLHTQAYRDEMTKVGNRAAFLEKEQMLNNLIKEGKLSDLAIIVVDINGLKWVNDYLGHDAGDLLIQNVSASLCQIFDHSPVYRMGGDEFAVILQGSDYQARIELIGQFKSSISCDCLGLDDLSAGKFSAAFGIAEFISEGDDAIQEVYARADQAMYKNKKEMKKRLSGS